MATEIESMLDRKKIIAEILDIPGSSRLNEMNDFGGNDHIIDYIHSHPELDNFLLESHNYLVKYFGTSAKFGLEVVHDPEARHEQLFVYINTLMPDGEALIRPDRFDNDWFLDHINWIGHLINFNLEII